ncbi:RNA polymerase sigma factor [uncultured Oscillibacter sp.]|uniref:RNA polymerase sigma factor n=1 Tax=uncultured Oscillibacter sp. TaxID=876091 RepID=UPI0025EDDF6B|nr:sigma-70 family RNA polymerase sigma factor [uncultured Oscillibacter sp.]
MDTAPDLHEAYARHARTVYRFLLSQCGDADLAEELTQETFYRAVCSIGRYDGTCKLSVWLCQIAKHLWYQHLRREKRESPLPEDGGETLLPPAPSAESETLDRAGRTDLLRRVHGLPEPVREVVYLRSFGGLSFREIGDVLGKTETWARVTFYRGKERLKEGGDVHEK